MSGMIVTSAQLNANRQFDALACESRQWALYVAYRKLGNMSDAEDLVQKAFVRAWRAFPQFNRRVSFRRWLYRIIVNLSIDSLRMSQKYAACSLDTGTGKCPDWQWDASLIPDRTEGPEELTISKDQRRQVLETLTMLPEKYAGILRLYAQQNCSYQDVADALGCPLGTVRSRIFRARRLLKKTLGNSLSAFAGDARLD